MLFICTKRIFYIIHFPPMKEIVMKSLHRIISIHVILQTSQFVPLLISNKTCKIIDFICHSNSCVHVHVLYPPNVTYATTLKGIINQSLCNSTWPQTWFKQKVLLIHTGLIVLLDWIKWNEYSGICQGRGRGGGRTLPRLSYFY